MIAIIPARGGSKGLPKKNIKPFNGTPLIGVTIQEAVKAKEIDRIIVSTDCEEIAEVALKYGAEIPFMRPSELATDEVSALDAYFYTIDRLSKDSNTSIEEFIVLLPTAPLRKAFHIDEAIQLFYEKNADSVISVTESPFPIEWTRKISQDGILCPYFEDGNKNRQEYKITYIPNGQIYIFKYERLKTTKNYYMEKTYAYITDKKYYGDIDDINDFILTEYKHSINECS